jgi:hypothetical protein
MRDETGSALVELALMMSFIGVPLLLGTIVANAAVAGAQYAMTSNTNASDTAGVQAAATAEATGLGATLVTTPTVFFVCSAAIGGTQYTTDSAANAACTGGNNHALEFIKVLTSATITPPVHPPHMAKSTTISSFSIMEVEE